MDRRRYGELPPKLPPCSSMVPSATWKRYICITCPWDLGQVYELVPVWWPFVGVQLPDIQFPDDLLDGPIPRRTSISIPELLAPEVPPAAAAAPIQSFVQQESRQVYDRSMPQENQAVQPMLGQTHQDHTVEPDRMVEGTTANTIAQTPTCMPSVPYADGDRASFEPRENSQRCVPYPQHQNDRYSSSSGAEVLLLAAEALLRAALHSENVMIDDPRPRTSCAPASSLPSRASRLMPRVSGLSNVDTANSRIDDRGMQHVPMEVQPDSGRRRHDRPHATRKLIDDRHLSNAAVATHASSSRAILLMEKESFVPRTSKAVMSQELNQIMSDRGGAATTHPIISTERNADHGAMMSKEPDSPMRSSTKVRESEPSHLGNENIEHERPARDTRSSEKFPARASFEEQGLAQEIAVAVSTFPSNASTTKQKAIGDFSIQVNVGGFRERGRSSQEDGRQTRANNRKSRNDDSIDDELDDVHADDDDEYDDPEDHGVEHDDPEDDDDEDFDILEEDDGVEEGGINEDEERQQALASLSGEELQRRIHEKIAKWNTDLLTFVPILKASSSSPNAPSPGNTAAPQGVISKKKSKNRKRKSLKETKPFLCLNCGSQFDRLGHSETHIKNVHFRYREYRCEKCGTRYGHDSSLKRHVEVCKGNIGG